MRLCLILFIDFGQIFCSSFEIFTIAISKALFFFGLKISPLFLLTSVDAPANKEHSTEVPESNASLTTAPKGSYSLASIR